MKELIWICVDSSNSFQFCTQ